MKKRSLLVSAVLVASILLSGCKIGGKEIVFETKNNKTEYVFSVGDTKCNVKQAKVYLCNYKNLYGNAYGVDLWDADFKKESLEDYIRNITLDELTKVVCMDVVAGQQEVKLSEEEVDKASKAAKAYYESLTEAELAFMEVNKEDMEEIYRNYALAEKLYDSLTEGINSEISDDDARVIRIQQVCVSDKAQADEIKEKIAAGTSFSAIASSYQNNTSADFVVGRGELPESLEAVAFELNDEEISDVIYTEGGYYFIKCLNKMEKDLTEANKKNILIKREMEQFDKVYEEFVGNAIFYLNEEVWNQINIDKDTVIETDSFFETYEKYFN